MERRAFFELSIAALIGCASQRPLATQSPLSKSMQDTLNRLAASSPGRLGVCILDTGSGEFLGSRHHERFALCSTFKMLLAAAVLRAVDHGVLRGDSVLPLREEDILPASPITSKRVQEGGMRVLELAEAAQTTSDNAAANLLLRAMGGPEALTQFVRSLGDAHTRLDHEEMTLNRVRAGEEHDTTTPHAMAHTTAAILTGNVLGPASRMQLTNWMIATQTGRKRIRAGLPSTWRAGDKTGTGTFPDITAKYNDVAIAWPPGRAPVVIAAYYDTDAVHTEPQEAPQAVLAEVGRIAALWIQEHTTR